MHFFVGAGFPSNIGYIRFHTTSQKQVVNVPTDLHTHQLNMQNVLRKNCIGFVGSNIFYVHCICDKISTTNVKTCIIVFVFVFYKYIIYIYGCEKFTKGTQSFKIPRFPKPFFKLRSAVSRV